MQANHAHAVIFSAAFDVILPVWQREIDGAAGAENGVLAGFGKLTVHIGHITPQQAFKGTGPGLRHATQGQTLNEFLGIFSAKLPKGMRTEIDVAVSQFRLFHRAQGCGCKHGAGGQHEIPAIHAGSLNDSGAVKSISSCLALF